MDKGAKLLLKGKSLKGKNRIREHGNEWVVKNVRLRKILVESKKRNSIKGAATGGDLRWIDLTHDRDFIVETIDG